MNSYSVNILVDMNVQRKDGINTDFSIINKKKEYKVKCISNTFMQY